jgi:hypothetical protein
MDPELGRFISEDNIPIDPNNPMTLNLYMYCSNNPVNRIDPSGHMDYLSQSDDLGAGIIDGIGDQIEGLKDAPEAIKTIAVAVIKGEITLDQLAEAGLEGVIGDYKYILENLSVFNPLQQNTDQEVYDMGKHVSGVVTDVALAATGVGAAKLFSVLSKTKSGAKVVKALKALSKSDEAAEVADDLSDLSKAINKVDDINGVKKVPNPSGKKGGELHQGKIQELTEAFKNEGYDISFEKRVVTTGGTKPVRYGDILVTNPKTGEQWIVQVGKQTKSGNPISREAKALTDLENAGWKVEFVPYN